MVPHLFGFFVSGRFSGQLMVKMAHKKPVYGLSINPKNNCVVSTAGDDGRILIYDIRSSGGKLTT